ncbi:uncharacterized protein GBIM_19452 [Gryllus bimaculatus]|nr:uncharacterized protein GBIM_19452 [Gryllus bimaculatus]
MNIHKKNANFQKKSPKIWKNRTQLTKGENNGEKEPNQQRQRVPAIYGATAKLLKKVNEGAGLKDALYQINHPNLRGIYALACKAIQNDELLGTIINETGLLNERFDPVLAKVLVTELLWGKQELKGGSTPVTLTLEHEKALRQAVEEASIPVVLTEEKPLRYIRINTLLVTINGTIQRLIDDGWQLQDTPENYELFIKCASNLGENQIMKDYHLDDVLIFPPKSDMHEHKLVENGSLLLQDKASCLPALAFLSKNLAGSLDITLFAVDKDPKRFYRMQEMVERNCGKHNCVTTKLADSVRLTSEDCPGVQYILIDPSCSGSGMASRVESRSPKEGMPSGRLQSLSTFQERLLVQAMTAFPDVERIVYSTCSLFIEENEQVLAKALSRVQSFQVVPPQLKKPWDRRGSPEYPFGSNCLVADKEKDKTNGFFVAVLERIPGSGSLSVKAVSKKRKSAALDERKDSDGWEVPKKKKKAKKNNKMQVEDQAEIENNANMNTSEENTQLTNPQNKGERKRKRHKERVPAIYGEAAKLVKENLQGIYSLAFKSIRNDQLLESLIKKTGLLNKKFEPNLAKILVTELLWGKQELKGCSPPVKLTLKHEEALRKALKEASIPVDLTEEKPLQYVRLNTLLVTINGTIQQLIDDGWQLKDTPETYELFIKCASNLGENQFMKDYHLDDVLIFPQRSNMHEHKLVENGSLLLQDKASCLPALLLDPKPGSVVLDMCAAPGLKTTQLVNLMENKGTIFAIDRDPKRFDEMRQIVERNCKEDNCVTMKLANSIQLTSEDCPGVQYILIDPSCSRCGMISRVESQRKKDVNPSGRIQSLSQYQERLLVQAMTAFPDVERIVYTTSSLFEEENEQVVAKALSRVQSFQVVPPQLKKPWDRRGSPEYPFGSNCLVADQDKDNTDGFFVAVLERIPGIACLSVNAMSEKRKNATLDETKDSDGGTEVKKEKKDQENKQLQIYDDGDEEAT